MPVGEGSGTWNTFASGSPWVSMMPSQLSGVLKWTLPSAMLTSVAWTLPASSKVAVRAIVIVTMLRGKLMLIPWG